MNTGIKQILKTVRSRVFTGQELNSEEIEFLQYTWDAESKFYKHMFAHTWDIKLAEFAANADFSPKNFFIRQSLIHKAEKGSYSWIADEVAQIHKDILVGKAKKEGKGYKIYKSNKMVIRVHPSKRLITLSQKGFKSKKNVTLVYERSYKLDELPLFKNIVSQMDRQHASRGPLDPLSTPEN